MQEGANKSPKNLKSERTGLVTPKIRKRPNSEKFLEEPDNKIKSIENDETALNTTGNGNNGQAFNLNGNVKSVREKELEIIEIIEEISSIGKKPTNEADEPIESRGTSKKRERARGPFIGSRKRRKRIDDDDETDALLSSRMKSLSWRSEEEMEMKTKEKHIEQKSTIISKQKEIKTKENYNFEQKYPIITGEKEINLIKTKEKDSFEQKSPIPSISAAPKCVAKSTGGYYRQMSKNNNKNNNNKSNNNNNSHSYFLVNFISH